MLCNLVDTTLPLYAAIQQRVRQVVQHAGLSEIYVEARFRPSNDIAVQRRLRRGRPTAAASWAAPSRADCQGSEVRRSSLERKAVRDEDHRPLEGRAKDRLRLDNGDQVRHVPVTTIPAIAKSNSLWPDVITCLPNVPGLSCAGRAQRHPRLLQARVGERLITARAVSKSSGAACVHHGGERGFCQPQH